MNNPSKSAIRTMVLKERKLLTPQDVEHKSQRIAESVYALPAFKDATGIMCYLNYKNEVVTDDIIAHCRDLGKCVIVPVVDETTRTLVLVDITQPTAYKLSSYGIREPLITEGNTRTLEDIDLILSPGVAFDLKGNRIGYGGGFYDKLLSQDADSRERIPVYALAFSMQIVEDIPADPLDQKINGIITEDNVYHF